MSDAIYNLKERLREEMADVMLVALRKEAGVILTNDEFYRLKDKIMDALRGAVTV